jgi:hypothetical protein
LILEPPHVVDQELAELRAELASRMRQRDVKIRQRMQWLLIRRWLDRKKSEAYWTKPAWTNGRSEVERATSVDADNECERARSDNADIECERATITSDVNR